VLRVPALDPPAQPPLEAVAVRVGEAWRERPARLALTLGRGADLDRASVRYGNAHAAADAARVEEEAG
jgi:hypothetical protein